MAKTYAPKSRVQMEEDGYKFEGRTNCKACRSPIEWWRTTRGKVVPFNPRPNDAYAPMKAHMESCTGKDDFKLRKLATDISNLRYNSKALIIVAVFADGAVAYDSERGMTPEDARNTIITAANHVRNLMDEETRKRNVRHY